jgi:hypothetical protein
MAKICTVHVLKKESKIGAAVTHPTTWHKANKTIAMLKITDGQAVVSKSNIGFN